MAPFNRNFWLYLTAGGIWSLGLMAFFLVYNLYLLDLGLDEAVMGQISSAMTLGSLAVTVPSGALLNRYGLNRMLKVSVIAAGTSLLLRSSVDVVWLLILFAFLSGAAIGIWMVCTPPFLTQNTAPATRSRAFSLSYGMSIGMGAVAGLFAGLSRYLSSWLARPTLPDLLLKKYWLCGSSVLVLSSFFLLLRLKENPADTPILNASNLCTKNFLRQLPSRPFILRLLIVLIFWSFFVGSFAPFFNVFFFRKYNQSLPGIGLIFSLSQVCQLSAVLSMPWLIRKLGRVPAIFAMQLAAAGFLPVLILITDVQLAALVYLIYLSFQVMCEPALENFIMDSVSPAERNIASALRYTTLFLIQALAVWITGYAITRLGYSVLLVLIAILGLSAAFTFYLFFRSGTIPSYVSTARPIN
jgi:predicted MFS family arabinose efflux permease